MMQLPNMVMDLVSSDHDHIFTTQPSSEKFRRSLQLIEVAAWKDTITQEAPIHSDVMFINFSSCLQKCGCARLIMMTRFRSLTDLE